MNAAIIPSKVLCAPITNLQEWGVCIALVLVKEVQRDARRGKWQPQQRCYMTQQYARIFLGRFQSHVLVYMQQQVACEGHS